MTGEVCVTKINLKLSTDVKIISHIFSLWPAREPVLRPVPGVKTRKKANLGEMDLTCLL